MSPEPYDFYGFFFFENLIDQTMLNGDSSRISAGQIAPHPFEGRGRLIRISLKNLEERDGSVFEARPGQLLRVFLGLASIDESPGYQSIFLRHFEGGVFKPPMIESRIPGMESR